MSRPRSTPPLIASVSKAKPWVIAFTAALACQASVAATLGHSRLLSAQGQPLRIDVQVSGLAPGEAQQLTARAAPQSDWIAAGLVPPVDLPSLTLSLVDGYAPGSKIIHVRSSQAFDKPVADLLLDVRTPSGRQRYQVSLLAHGQSGIRQQGAASSGGQASRTAQPAPAQVIRVHKGDNMLSIAARHAVKDVTIYQMMMALQRANPQAFIEDNVNLVKAGARLTMPDMAALTALSDHEARRLFQEQAQAYALYRQRLAGKVVTAGDKSTAAAGLVSAGGEGPVADAAGNRPQDQLRLSGHSSQDGADDRSATHANIDESVARVSQLEENVHHLNKALQAQGGAASNLVMEGARTLSETFAATIGGTAQDGKQGPGGAASGKSASAATTQGAGGNAGTPSGQSADAGGTDAASAEGAGGSGVHAAGANEVSTGGGAAEANADGAGGNAAGANGNASGSTAGSANQAAGGAGQASASAGKGPAGEGTGTPGENGTGDIQSGSGTSSGAATAHGPQGSADGTSSPNTAGAEGSTEASGEHSTKAGQTVSWFQEHTLGVMTGVLALIVLIIAWLLRRANAARSDGRDGVITEAMVQEKLDQINLDFESPNDKTRTPRG